MGKANGSIEVLVKFVENKLYIKILGCKNLKDADIVGKSDPYVKVYLLPGGDSYLKTKTIENNLNPTFDTTFSYTVSREQVINKTVVFQVFDDDKLDKDDPLGEAQLCLREVSGEEQTFSLNLGTFTVAPPIVENKLEWSGEGSEVKIAGEFNSWTPADTKLEDNTYIFTSHLSPGRYTYKWVVDGNWIVNNNQPTITDESGNVNNVIVVESISGEQVSDLPKEDAHKPEADQEMRAASEETSGELSGDSDSWERVSVGDCATTETENKSSSEKKEEVKKCESVGDITKEGFVMADANATSEKKKSVIKIERIFSSSCAFEAKMSESKEGVEEENYEVNYWDTPEFSLLKDGVWCKQVKDQWILRKLIDNKVHSIKSEDEIEKNLQSILDTQDPLSTLIKTLLTRKIQFSGATTRWKLDNIDIERIQEGNIKTVTLRIEDCMIDGLKKIYSLAENLSLQKLKLV